MRIVHDPTLSGRIGDDVLDHVAKRHGPPRQPAADGGASSSGRVTCGALLAEADACVMVVDARQTSREVARQALAAADVGPDKLAGLVLDQRPRPIPRWLGGD